VIWTERPGELDSILPLSCAASLEGDRLAAPGDAGRQRGQVRTRWNAPQYREQDPLVL